jgi:hypothetical protein
LKQEDQDEYHAECCANCGGPRGTLHGPKNGGAKPKPDHYSQQNMNSVGRHLSPPGRGAIKNENQGIAGGGCGGFDGGLIGI